jgi:ribosomal protein L18
VVADIMLKQVVAKYSIGKAAIYGSNREKLRPFMCQTSCRFHNGRTVFAPRSFFGVEDYVDDDTSRPYTYQKEKKSKNPDKHVSFKQRTVAYMEPFTLDVFISKRFVSASLTHRVTCRQVAVAGTNSKDVKAVLRSRCDIPACMSIGRILSERAKEADVYTASYTPRDQDKFEGKIRAVVQSLIDNGIDVKIYLD